jgi:putative salt-induced outer membrane protein YdiY
MRSKWAVLLLVLLLPTYAQLLAEDSSGESTEEKADQETEEKPLWEGGLGFSYLATAGNTDTESFGLDLKIDRRATPWGVKVRGKFNRAEENDHLTAERYFLMIQALRGLSERIDLFAALSGEQDRFAGIDFRVVVAGGVEWKALLGPKHLLDIDLGLTWTDETGLLPEFDDSFIGSLLGLDYSWVLSKTAKLTQTATFFFNFDQTDEWRLTTDTGLQAQVIERLAVKLSYEIRYDNKPLLIFKDTDTIAKASVVLRF